MRGCKVTWSADSRQLVTVQADEKCQEPQGSLIRITVGDERDQKELAAIGDNPTVQPLTAGG